MNDLKDVVSLFITLFICVLDGYSMMNYRVKEKSAYGCFAGITLFCLLLNTFIILHYGDAVFNNIIIFTIGLPYLILILMITGDKVSQTLFNFWLWINVYGIISNFSVLINDYTFRSTCFLTAVRCTLLVSYFVFYNKLVKRKHKLLMENLKVNWWIFSFIPMCFTVLLCMVNYYFGNFNGYTRNYPVVMTIHILMVLVYILIFYTFKTVHDSMESERLAQSMREQIVLQKKQYEFYIQREEAERIFRHDARHRDAMLLNCMEKGDTEKAKSLLKCELNELHNSAEIRYCNNILINAVLCEYALKAQKKDIEFSVSVKVPDRILCDESEFCIMLSNLLENSIDAAKSYIEVSVKCLNNQLSLNVKNDYTGEIRKNADGCYMTTKQLGSGLGLKSVSAIVKKNGGLLKIDDRNGVFDVCAALRNF